MVNENENEEITFYFLIHFKETWNIDFFLPFIFFINTFEKILEMSSLAIPRWEMEVDK